MVTLRTHVDGVMEAEDWCRGGAAIVLARDPDTATWYAQVDTFTGFVNIWWIANPEAAREFILQVVEDLVENMHDCDARVHLGAMVGGDADLDECLAWCKANHAETECCNLVGKLATALADGPAYRRYGMLITLVRASAAVQRMPRPDADAALLASAREAAPLEVWRGSFE